MTAHAELARSPRFVRIAQVLRDEFGRLYGIATEQVDPHESFLALGADSLMLLRASRFVRDQFGVRVPFRDLLDGLGTVHALAAHVHGQLPAEEQAASADAPPSGPSAAVSAPKSSQIPSISADARFAMPFTPTPGGGAVERIVAQQLRVMQEQLDALGAARSMAAPTISADAVDASASAGSPPPDAVRTSETPQPKGIAAASASHDGVSEDGERPLTAEQAAHVAALSERLSAMTAGSRDAVEADREAVAEPRSVAGFRAAWKHLCYPLAVASASGGRFTDVDGNEFVDLEMRGGDLVLGHASGIATDAMRAALDAPSPRAAAEAAALIREMAGVERVAFFASRGDATAAALRIARTATERDLIAVFAGADHGSVDGLMGRGTPLRDGRAVPSVAGVPAGMVSALLVLEGADALETLRARGFDVAAVVVDAAHLPCGEMDAGEFVRALERICLDTGAALVLDESATMPRVHPGGVARMHGIEADLIVLSNAIGNGAPVAAVAGKASYMDTVDGGPWSLLDGSEPRIETTCIRGDEPHALGIAAAAAVLGHVREHGIALSAEMSRLAELLASAIRVALGDDAPLAVEISGSRITLAPREGAEADADLLRLHLRSRGVHLPVSGVCYLSSAHTDADVERAASAVEHAIREMRAEGFLAAGASPDAASTRSASRESASPEFASTKSAATAYTESVSHAFTAVRNVVVAEMAEDESEGVELPLTAGQREMWLLAQISAEAARAYHEPTALRIRGPFSVDAMTAALRELVARHEALRTRFGALGQTQHVEASVSLEVPLIDLSALPHDEAEAELAAALANEAAQPFDLAAAPLFRARIVRMGEADHVLAFTLHHAVTDGWSNGTLLGELQAIYAARLEGRAHALPAPHRYRDAVRLRAAASESDALAFWRERLAAPLPALELPLDRARPATQTFAGALKRREMDAGLRARLDTLCEARGTTFYGLLLAAFQLFLHRITGQADVLVGTIAAGQAWDEDAAAVGYFVDLLPLRSTLAGDPGFGDFADAANAGLFDALEHRGLPLSRLVEALDIPRDPSRPPLLAAVLNWHRAAGAGLRFGHADAERLEAHGATSKFELTVTAVESAAGTWLDWEYNTDLFDAATIRRWMGHFETLLAAAAADPARPVRELPLLAPPELHRVLEEWNAAAPGDSADECLHTPFERQAAATPHAVALETADERVTYAELDARADRVGHALRRLGVGPDTVVGLCAERSVAMVVGMIGILKAGGAYLPLDPSLPADRLAYMVENAAPAAVLAQAGSVDALPSIDRPVLLIEDAERE
ncbi:MAG TPA: aminotransferase class III-fold pyridoxal phosphate-dependent enzyme, partial [Longimicrobiaceae bacterium]|nr:aminotransferase class III-fold pyridoxal phosphate-dependent enzyme [Longimicrobiaceae bacterium]